MKLIYVTRDADHTLQVWSEQPEFVEKDWKPDYWHSEDCEPGSVDEEEFVDLLPGGMKVFELQEVMDYE